MRYHSALFGKSFNMLGLPAQIRFGNKQREICVLMAGLLEFVIKYPLHLLPYCVAVRLDYHTAAYGCLLCKVGLHNQFVIPLRVIIASFSKVFKFFSHSCLISECKDNSNVQTKRALFIPNAVYPGFRIAKLHFISYF